jgi:nitroimidazol reductase NimA-like FMN-containing flavoprotein (pyridoxamine 5'-phosphate oxidase superfamily)
MNFGIEEKIWPPAIWLHCAKEGLKLDLIRKNPNVGFEADCSHKLITSEDASRFTMEYESIAGFGEISICDGADSKIKGLKSILKHYAPEKEFDIPNQALQAVCILRLDILQISGKRLKV